MSAPETVCAFCNRGASTDKMLEAVRRLYPEAYIIACVPEGHPTRDVTRKYADEVINEVPASGTVFRLTGLIQLARKLRKRRINLLLLQFESLKLRLLSAAIGPERCWVWLVNGRALALPTCVPGTIAQLMVLRARFIGRMLRLLLFTYLVPVRPSVRHRPR